MDNTQRIRISDIDIIKTNRWLKIDGLKKETKKLIIAAQETILPTRIYQANI